MFRGFNRLVWRTILLAIFFLLIFAIWQYTLEAWNIYQVSEYMIKIVVYGVPSLLLMFILYKTFIERIILKFNRKKSATVIVDKLSKINQISGAVRVGKDSSTVGASILARELILKRERKELLKFEHDLYIYNFDLIKEWLNKNGKKFFVASEYRINLVFTQMLKENDCFIAEYWKKKVDHKKHFSSWKYKKNKYVPDVAFKDGLTPGGIHFLDMLKRYTVLYMYHNFVPNFIMSNQPILESFKVIKKTGRINRLFSKKFSQDYFKLKENTPIPFPKRGFIIETETAIFYSNTDSKEEGYFKDKSGMREFYTTAGHILREEVFVYGITQSPTRTLKALRELYPGYQHIFKMKFRSTSGFTRLIIKFRSQIKKLNILVLRLSRWIYQHSIKHNLFDNLTTKRIDKVKGKITRLSEKDNRTKLKKFWILILRYKYSIYLLIKKRKFYDVRITNRIYRIKHKISKLSQKDATKWSKGYIIFYKGIYEEINDVGKRVSFPKLGVILENKSEITTYGTYGFKQTNKITDCFGRYDTHFMYTIREAKEILQDMHFMDVQNWDGFKVKFQDIEQMNYATFNALMTIVLNEIKETEKKQKKLRNKEKQKWASIIPPDFTNLDTAELENLASDFGIEFKKLDYTFKFNRDKVVKKLVICKHKEPELDTKTLQQLHLLATAEQIEYLTEETIIEKWQEHIIKSLLKEYKSYHVKTKHKSIT